MENLFLTFFWSMRLAWISDDPGLMWINNHGDHKGYSDVLWFSYGSMCSGSLPKDQFFTLLRLTQRDELETRHRLGTHCSAADTRQCRFTSGLVVSLWLRTYSYSLVWTISSDGLALHWRSPKRPEPGRSTGTCWFPHGFSIWVIGRRMNLRSHETASGRGGRGTAGFRGVGWMEMDLQSHYL